MKHAATFVSVLVGGALLAGTALAQTTTPQPPASSPPAAPSGTDPSKAVKPEPKAPHTVKPATKPEKGAPGASIDAERVRALQEALRSKGHDPGPSDGVMGPKTMAALRSFQKAENLQETGRPGPETLDKLGVK